MVQWRISTHDNTLVSAMPERLNERHRLQLAAAQLFAQIDVTNPHVSIPLSGLQMTLRGEKAFVSLRSLQQTP